MSQHGLNIPQFRERIIIVFVRKECLKSTVVDFEKDISNCIDILIQNRKLENKNYSIHNGEDKELMKYQITELQQKTLDIWQEFVSYPEWDTIDNQELNDIYTRTTGKKNKRNFKIGHFFTDFLDNSPLKEIYVKTCNYTFSLSFLKTSDIWNVLYHNNSKIKYLTDSFLKNTLHLFQHYPTLPLFRIFWWKIVFIYYIPEGNVCTIS